MQIGPPWTPDRRNWPLHCERFLEEHSYRYTNRTKYQCQYISFHHDRHNQAEAQSKRKEKSRDQLQNIDIGPDTDDQRNVNPIIVKSNEIAHGIFTNNETFNDVGSFTETVKKAAIETFNIKPSKGKKQDCDPEIATLIDKRLQAISQYNEEEAKQITKSNKKMATQKKTNVQLNEFYAGNRISVKRARMGFIPGHTELRNQRGEIVNDRLRADTFAEYHEEVHWAPNNTQNDPEFDVKQEPIYTTRNEINIGRITAEELDQAIKQLCKTKQTPGPDGLQNSIDG